jgi:hypothetical protein
MVTAKWPTNVATQQPKPQNQQGLLLLLLLSLQQ